jgi:hypothetical protein
LAYYGREIITTVKSFKYRFWEIRLASSFLPDIDLDTGEDRERVEIKCCKNTITLQTDIMHCTNACVNVLRRGSVAQYFLTPAQVGTTVME